MEKQINFFATENDRIMIADILNSIFVELINVPYYKGQLSSFDPKEDNHNFYLAEKSRESDIFYRTHEYYDSSVAEVLDYRKSPTLEYSVAFRNQEGEYVKGRFYCCSEDSEFSKKVSKFFTKLKKEFWYVKKRKTYISKSIDVENTFFFIPNSTVRIEKEELK